MYPGMARTAREEGFDDVAEWFETLAMAERSHAGRFQVHIFNMYSCILIKAFSKEDIGHPRVKSRK